MFASIGKPMGDGRYILPALGALYCYGRFTGNNRARRTALLGFESAVISGAITGGIKYLSHKQRPSSRYVDDIPWGGPALSAADVSFPSGHSACAFAVCTVLASEYSDNSLVPPLAYGVAALCAFSRLNDNAHWLSDVIVGSAIGHFTARAVIRMHGGSNGRHFSVAPVVSRGSPGLSLSYRF
jgi:membrane-associated phospholipid phosphatase